jgi:radical SAM superfamily enzyme YgiQ (UPF0313 family)
MRILLGNARRSAHTGESTTAPPLGLLTLAAVLRAGTFHDTTGAQVEVVDDDLAGPARRGAGLPGALRGRLPDIVGIHALTSSLGNGLRLAAEARQHRPTALVVLGGVGAAGPADRLVADGTVDVVVPGEAEYTFSDLVHRYAAGGRRCLQEVRGIVFRDDAGWVVRTPGVQVADLDRLPPPARDLADPRRYRTADAGRVGHLVAARGCPHGSWHPQGGGCAGNGCAGDRRHGVPRVVAEIRELVERYGCDRVRIDGEDVVGDPVWTAALCTAISRSGLAGRFEWETTGRLHPVDDDLARMLRAAGCSRLALDAGPLDWRQLRRLGRTVQVQAADRALTGLAGAGIGVHLTATLGIPGESAGAMRETLAWLRRRLDGADRNVVSIRFFVPYRDGAARDATGRVVGRVETPDLDCWTGSLPVTSSPGASISELWQLYTELARTPRSIRRPVIRHLRSGVEHRPARHPERRVG